MGKVQEDQSRSKGVSTVFKVGAISFAFLIIGYEAALFMHRAAQLQIVAHRDQPDTVYVIDEVLAARVLSSISADAEAPASSANNDWRCGLGRTSASDTWAEEVPVGAHLPKSKVTTPGASSAQRIAAAKVLPNPHLSQHKAGEAGTLAAFVSAEGSPAGTIVIRKNASHAEQAQKVAGNAGRRKVESFPFNPNTASSETLQRLGFTEKQAQAIISYREKGGRFRRKQDFARSFVVSDSVYQRLEKYIDIPLTDINTADSAAFDALPGIGSYFAKKMVEYRTRLGGYSYKEQLMDLYHFDEDKFAALQDLIYLSPGKPFKLWTLPEDSLRTHPYIRSWQTAHSIVLFRKSMPAEKWTVEELKAAGILSEEDTRRLSRCNIDTSYMSLR